MISTIAGNGTAGAGGNGGPARLATLNSPFNIAVEPSGSLLIGDEGSSTVRRIINPPPPPPATDGGGGGIGSTLQPPPPPVILSPTPRIDSKVSITWGVSGRKIYLLRLKATKVPAGATLQLRCKGRKCPFKVKSSKRVRRNAITLYKGDQALAGGRQAPAQLPRRSDAPGLDHGAGNHRQGRQVRAEEGQDSRRPPALPAAGREQTGEVLTGAGLGSCCTQMSASCTRGNPLCRAPRRRLGQQPPRLAERLQPQRQRFSCLTASPPGGRVCHALD